MPAHGRAGAVVAAATPAHLLARGRRSSWRSGRFGAALRRPRLSVTLATALVTLIAGLPPAQADDSLQSDSPHRVSPAGISSPNLEWLRTVPIGARSPSGRKVEQYFYATDWFRGLVIFDISDPERPREVGSLTLPQIGEPVDITTSAHAGENEDIATNGRIALISQFGNEHYAHVPDQDGEPAGDPSVEDDQLHRVSVLNIVDVSDEANPKVIAKLPGAGDHTYECLFDCTWAYGAVGGHIVDLRKPSMPELSKRKWHDGLDLAPFNPAHDVFEVRPGLVLTGTMPRNLLLDVRDPENPVMLAESEENVPSSFHQVNWPNQGHDRFILGGSEGLAPSPSARCEVTATINETINFNIGFHTWDASRWHQDDFEFVDHYLPSNGTYIDGDPAVSPGGIDGNGGCSAHYFDPHPSFRNGGLVAHSTWGHGMKLLEVESMDGLIVDKPVGFFLPHARATVAAYWITPYIVYSIDAERGIDVLRYLGKIPG